MWNFSRLDDQLQKARDLNLSVVLAIWGTAKWAVDSTYYYTQCYDTTRDSIINQKNYNNWRSYYWRCPVKHFPEKLKRIAINSETGDTIVIDTVLSIEFFGDTGRGLWYAAFDSIIRHVNEKYADVVKAWVIWPEPETNLRDNSYQSRNYWVRIDAPPGYDTLLAIPYFYPEMCSEIAQIIKNYNPSWKVIIGALNAHPDGVNYQDYPNPPNVSKIQYSLNHYSVIERYKYLMDNIPNVEDIDAIGIDFYTSVGPYYVRDDADSDGYWFTQYFGDPPYQADPVEDTGYVDNSIKILHPVRDMLDSLRAAISLAGWQGKTIWVLETGYPTTPYSPFDTTYTPPQFTLTADSQALFLARLLKEYLKYAEDDVADLEKIIVFRGKDRNGGIVVDTVPLHFDPTNIPPDTQLNDTVFYVDTLLYSWGIIGHDRINYSPKPAFYVYQNVIEGSKIPSLLSWDSKSTYGNNSRKIAVQTLPNGDKRLLFVYQSDDKIYFTYSDDGGETWSERVEIGRGISPALTVIGDKIYVVFKDVKSKYICLSLFDGDWHTNIEVFSENDGWQIHGNPAITSGGGYVYISFAEWRSDLPQESHLVFGKAASSFKITFDWDTVITSSRYISEPSISCTWDGLPIIAYEEYGRIYLIGWDEKSEKWTRPFLVTRDEFYSIHPFIDVDEKGYVHTVWETKSEVHYIYVKYDGIEFRLPPEDILVVGESNGEGYPVLGHYGGNIYFSWSKIENRNNPFIRQAYDLSVAEYINEHLYVRNVTNTFLDSRYPSLVVVDASSASLIWTEGGYGAYRIGYYSGSLMPGVTLLSPQFCELYQSGSTLHISWKGAPSLSNIPIIEYQVFISYDGGVTYENIYTLNCEDTVINDTMTYDYELPDTVVSREVRVKVVGTDLEGREGSDESGIFEIWWMVTNTPKATGYNQEKIVRTDIKDLNVVFVKWESSSSNNTFYSYSSDGGETWDPQSSIFGRFCGRFPVICKDQNDNIYIIENGKQSAYTPDKSRQMLPYIKYRTPDGQETAFKVPNFTDTLDVIRYFNAIIIDTTFHMIVSGYSSTYGEVLEYCTHSTRYGDENMADNEVIIDTSSTELKEPFIYRDPGGLISIVWIDGNKLKYVDSNDFHNIQIIAQGNINYPTISSYEDTIMVMWAEDSTAIKIAQKSRTSGWIINNVYTPTDNYVFSPYLKYGNITVWIDRKIPPNPEEPDTKYYVKYALRAGSQWDINTLYTEDAWGLYYPHFTLYKDDSTRLFVIWTEGWGTHYKVNYSSVAIPSEYYSMALASIPSRNKLITYLAAPYPNPSSGIFTVKYQVSDKSRVKIRLYDIQGRCVSNIVNELKDPGVYSVEFRGTDKYGERLPQGIYFLEMEAGKYRKVRKISLVR